MSSMPSDARAFFARPKAINDFDAMRVSLASPEKIRSWSHGEVVKPETINYRTFKPERDGLFCARIFGPVTDWECLCGKYKRMKHRGVVCDKCGVEVTRSKVRRERMGHIELAAPVSHVWFFKGLPSRIGQLLDVTMRDLERVLYFEVYVVVDPGDTTLEEKQILTEEQYREYRQQFGESFVAKMGAEAIQELLQRIDLDEAAGELRLLMRTESSVVKRQKAAKRLRVVEAFRKSGNRPEWMILEVVPVIPPELRPLVPLDGGRFATSDLNDLYRRVINRNNRLKKLLELRAPEVIVRNEKRMLQEAVDALFDNGRRGRVIKGSNGRPLKSLSDALKGKQGRFRQNLLGKRVDYSGRSVIVVGPELQLHQCGLPKEMALELFKPFIYHELEKKQLVTTIKMARELVDQRTPDVWDALETVIREHPVLLNRAPTLHRLGIQGFEPVLVEGKAIRIHPLVCAAYNADFDGDQMAVHVPLSPVAQLEARVLMLAPRNILSPASGKPLAVPSQDMVLGIYYLTSEKIGADSSRRRLFASVDEVLLAHANGRVDTLHPIEVIVSGNLLDMTVEADSQDILHAEAKWVEGFHLETTVGRVILNASLPPEIPFVNAQLKKSGLQSLVSFAYLRFGHPVTVRLLDALKNLGFMWATQAGISIGSGDMIVPDSKGEMIANALREVDMVEGQRAQGVITSGERHNRIVDIWHRVTEKVSDEMFRQMRRRTELSGEANPIFIMADSGARGSKEQVRQIAGMRGLMSKPSGEIIETPITANFREGLSVLQYFISTHGARKGLADTALKTADSGYLTRRLVDVAQDVIITEDDCGTDHGIFVTPITEGGEVLEKLRDRLVGRVVAEDIVDPVEGTMIAPANTQVTEEVASAIEDAGYERVKIRSLLTCETRRGACRMCYGRMLATGRQVEMGEAVGIIAAQSIGEPGTQLTMRTFHYGGAATRATEQSQHKASRSGTVKLINVQAVVNTKKETVVVARNAKVAVCDDRGRERERYNLVYGSVLQVSDGDWVEPNTALSRWDPFTSSVLTTVAGRVAFDDLIEGENVREETDKITGHTQKIVIEPLGADRRIPTIVVHTEDNTERRYQLAIGSHLMVAEGDTVSSGDVLAKIPRETTKTKDITGGLPRVVELFEARRPKDAAVVSEISGIVHIGEASRGTRKVIVEGREQISREYAIPKAAHLIVQDGEWVQSGESLTDGPVDPHDVLAVLGETELQRHLLDKIQEVYRTQGVTINDKHIETIVRQMCRFVKITDPGDTDFLLEEQVPRYRVQEENERIERLGGQSSRFAPILLGITKAALATESFVSAASFQETTRVLTEAAVSGRVDHLHGLKENVIVGRLIPAGTGVKSYHHFTVAPVAPEEMPQLEEVEGMEEVPDLDDITAALPARPPEC
ncbi:MAG: DNA-directed RNA polymerase subunit beta' [Thermoanaerobaculaceae bacterium]|nr:DNA-directed RNA polymerase subunit beta' [Thermoanaerobaculaceae bacterium]MDI9622237.1 DNA-directed RNA polymerase subunit beta' [Acidobacteriota bacterium]